MSTMKDMLFTATIRTTGGGRNPFEAWIRKNDGYLLRYIGKSRSGNTTFT